MGALRRLSTTLLAHFDRLVTTVENHDAIVSAAIAEVNHAEARAKVRFAALKRDGEKMRNRASEIARTAAAWRERAIQSEASAKGAALECVRRMRRAEADHTEVLKEIEHHHALERKLSDDLARIAARLDELKRKRIRLRTRESHAEALTVGSLDNRGLVGELDEIMERWEIRVTEVEAASEGTRASTDEFTSTFETAEEKAELEAVLVALKNETTPITQGN